MKRFVLSMIAAILLLPALLPGGAAHAAAIELTVPVQQDVTATAAAAGTQKAAQLQRQYREFRLLIEEDRTLEAKIKALHYRNEEEEDALRRQIRAIGAADLDKLEAAVGRLKATHQPLFDRYAAANKRLATVRKLKVGLLTKLAQAEADLLKAAVTIAKQEIKDKEQAHAAAKAAVAARVKAAREALAAADPLKVRIRAKRSAAGLPRKGLSPAWTNFKYAIRKRDHASAFKAIATLNTLARQVTDQQRAILDYEEQISLILNRVKSQVR